MNFRDLTILALAGSLGSVQVLYKQVFPISGPSPTLNKQYKHGLMPPPPNAYIILEWGFARISIIYPIKFKLPKKNLKRKIASKLDF